MKESEHMAMYADRSSTITVIHEESRPSRRPADASLSEGNHTVCPQSLSFSSAHLLNGDSVI